MMRGKYQSVKKRKAKLYRGRQHDFDKEYRQTGRRRFVDPKYVHSDMREADLFEVDL
jgi:hypothetical protein